MIRVGREGDRVFLEVEDNGKGMSPEKLLQIQSQGSGVGIRGMRERIRQLNGHLDIQSNTHGTKISITFPAAEVDSSGQKLNIQKIKLLDRRPANWPYLFLDILCE